MKLRLNSNKGKKEIFMDYQKKKSFGINFN